MNSDFWHQVWENEQLGFHSPQPNAYLKKFWPELNLETGSAVFVPLAGKSVDMLWLREQSHTVRGVELSPIAAEAFFSENNLSGERRSSPPFEIIATDQVEFWIGDFFNLQPADFEEFDGVYDRAALVALPLNLRQAYAAHMADLLPTGCRMLLFAFEYDQDQMSGPPFSVADDEIRTLYASDFSIKLLASRELIKKAPGMSRQGLESFIQNMYLLERR